MTQGTKADELSLRAMLETDLDEFYNAIREPRLMTRSELGREFIRDTTSGLVVTRKLRRQVSRTENVAFLMMRTRAGYISILSIATVIPLFEAIELMMKDLKSILANSKGSLASIRCYVPETHSFLLMSLRDAGYRGSLKKGYFEGQDGILMRYPGATLANQSEKLSLTNRITSKDLFYE